MFRPNRELGALGFTFGSRSTGQAQKFSYPDNRCPRGFMQTGSGSDKPPWGYSAPWGDFVMCKPEPRRTTAPTPAPPPPQITVQTTVSPTMQTDISPQISPVFSQMQDSPGAKQAASTAQVKPGGMSADKPSGGGGQSTAEIIEFMRAQAELDNQRRQAESAQRAKDIAEQDRREREARERQYADQQKQQAAQQAAAQQDLQNREAARQQQLELQRQQSEASAKRQEQIDAEWRAANEQKQAAYEEALKQRPAPTPSTLVSTAVMPGRQMIPAPTDDNTIVIDKGLPQDTGPNWLLIAGGVVVAGGVYYLSTKKGKRK